MDILEDETELIKDEQELSFNVGSPNELGETEQRSIQQPKRIHKICGEKVA